MRKGIFLPLRSVRGLDFLEVVAAPGVWIRFLGVLKTGGVRGEEKEEPGAFCRPFLAEDVLMRVRASRCLCCCCCCCWLLLWRERLTGVEWAEAAAATAAAAAAKRGERRRFVDCRKEEQSHVRQ